MQQLPPLDSLFLSTESTEMPSHIGGLAILDPSDCPGGADVFDFDRFRDFVAGRLPACPRFQWTVQEVPFGLDQPYWVDSGDIDIARHVTRVAVPSPGTTHELAELAGMLFEKQLDRSRPLWEMFFIEGLQGGRVALLWKVHHALMDGQAGAGLIDQLFDLSAAPPQREIVPVEDKAVAGAPRSLMEMAQQSTLNAAKRPAALLKNLAQASSDMIDSLREKGLDGIKMAPAVSFNGAVSAQRSVAWSSVDLSELKRAKETLGVTVNDVILGITGGAVRRYLDAHDELPEESLRVSVPVSIRAEGDRSMGNQINEVTVDWGTDRTDPIPRIRAIHEEMKTQKAEAAKGGLNMLEAMAESLPPSTLGLLMKAAGANVDSMPLPTNAVVSNVRLTDVPLYMAGARIEAMVPMSILAPTQGMNVTVLSYDGSLHFGVTADPALLPNPWEITDAIPKALLELSESISIESKRI